VCITNHVAAVPDIADMQTRRPTICTLFPYTTLFRSDQRDRGDALDDEVAGPVLGRAQAARHLQRVAQMVARALHAAPPCIMATAQTSAVSTRLPITAIQLLRTKPGMSKDLPASCSRCRMPLIRW